MAYLKNKPQILTQKQDKCMTYRTLNVSVSIQSTNHLMQYILEESLEFTI